MMKGPPGSLGLWTVCLISTPPFLMTELRRIFVAIPWARYERCWRRSLSGDSPSMETPHLGGVPYARFHPGARPLPGRSICGRPVHARVWYGFGSCYEASGRIGSSPLLPAGCSTHWLAYRLYEWAGIRDGSQCCPETDNGGGSWIDGFRTVERSGVGGANPGVDAARTTVSFRGQSN